MRTRDLISILFLCFAACGDGSADSGTREPAPTRQPAATPTSTTPSVSRPTGPLERPAWFSYDEEANTVQLTLVAGETSRSNHWNYNGHIEGEIEITVPVGSAVNIAFTNADPIMAHSVGVSSATAPFTTPPSAEPAFEGAISSSPLSMVEGGLPGSTEVISFVADEAGEYTLVCFVPGHSAVGMWMYFTVSAQGEAGVRGL